MPKKTSKGKKVRPGYFEHLTRKTVELSVADNWEEAKYEWGLYSEYIYNQQIGQCICGNRLKIGDRIFVKFFRKNGDQNLFTKNV